MEWTKMLAAVGFFGLVLLALVLALEGGQVGFVFGGMLGFGLLMLLMKVNIWQDPKAPAPVALDGTKKSLGVDISWDYHDVGLYALMTNEWLLNTAKYGALDADERIAINAELSRRTSSKSNSGPLPDHHADLLRWRRQPPARVANEPRWTGSQSSHRSTSSGATLANRRSSSLVISGTRRKASPPLAIQA